MPSSSTDQTYIDWRPRKLNRRNTYNQSRTQQNLLSDSEVRRAIKNLGSGNDKKV